MFNHRYGISTYFVTSTDKTYIARGYCFYYSLKHRYNVSNMMHTMKIACSVIEPYKKKVL